ncbi:HDOD domain-containing protein [uncultured Desulfobacter sp.]|uniref:HDOD domain-containing protein n=1 Tax=uncultured Desulfobacter sp. TaxID=240139 RepID=UPI002AAB0ADB|nr:HDOD domain-containing protein [uncultured Desulfobacter sp.]
MNDRDSSHTGIDLDVIRIEELVETDTGEPGKFQERLRSDPNDPQVYVNALLKKMQGREAFLTFSQQVNNVNEILKMDYSSARDIAQVILKDLSLTTQVLKLVNTPIYLKFSNKGISTISEAMILLGEDKIRELAAGLKIFEMMKSRANSQLLKDKMLKSLYRSAVARQLEMEKGVRASDAFTISAMLYELGEYMVALLDPDTYIRVEVAMEEEWMSREDAAKAILGLTYFDLGQMVAQKLNLPWKIVQAMQPVTLATGQPLHIAPEEETRYLCAFIYELSNIPAPVIDLSSFDAASKLVDKYSGLLDFDAEQALNLTYTAMNQVIQYAKILGIDPVSTPCEKSDSGIKNKEKLDLGISKVEDALAEGLSIHQIFTRLIDTMAQCFSFNQVIINIKKKETNTMEPRFIRGEKRSDGFIKAMGFKIGPASDIFNNAIHQQTDIIVNDTKMKSFRRQIPSWYMDEIAGPLQIKGFGIFPVFVDGKIVSMIYVDWNKQASEPDQDTLANIQGFKNQMIKAFTQHAG